MNTKSPYWSSAEENFNINTIPFTMMHIYTQALLSKTIVYLLLFRKSNYLFFFCTINHFVRLAVTFLFPNSGYLIWNETHHWFLLQTALIIPFLPYSFLFIVSSSSSSSSSPVQSGPVCRPVRQLGFDISVRDESACLSVSHSSLQSQLCRGKH